MLIVHEHESWILKTSSSLNVQQHCKHVLHEMSENRHKTYLVEFKKLQSDNALNLSSIE